MVAREYIHKKDIRLILDDLQRDASQVAMGSDAPSERYTFPMVLFTGSYPTGAGHIEKEEWATRTRQVLRRHFGWGVRLGAFLEAFREVGWPEGGGAVLRASPPAEEPTLQLAPSDTDANRASMT